MADGAAGVPTMAGGAAADPASSQQPEAESRPALFPFRLLGLGFLLTWDWCLHEASNLTWSSAPTSSGTQATLGASAPSAAAATLGISFTLSLTIACVVVLIALPIAVRRFGVVSRHRGLIAISAVAGILGSAGALAMSNALLPLGIWEWVSGALVGFSTGILMLLWAEIYSRLEASRVFLFGSLSLVLSGALVFLFAELAQPCRAASVIVVPSVSFLLAALSSRYVGSEPLDTRAGIRYTFPWKPVIIMAFCGLAAGFVGVALFTQGTYPHVYADTAIGAFIAIGLIVLRSRVKPVQLVGISLGAVALGMLFIAIFGAGSGFVAALLMWLSYAGISFFVFALLANLSHRYTIPSLWLFGFAIAAREIASHIGGFANHLFPTLDRLSGSHLQLAILAAIGLIAIVVLALMWASERSASSNWAVLAVDIHTGEHVPSAQELLVERCEKVAAAHDLTERETEIMQMLADRRTYQEICQNLFLSQNTVKTHARHIYGKLGVHNREEMLQMVDGGRHDNG